MDNRVSVRIGGQCITPNEDGTLEFKTGGGMTTKIEMETLHEMVSRAQSVEAVIRELKDTGIYIGDENSRVIIVTTPNGAQIFSKDEPSRKVTVDRDLPEYVINEILAINDYSDPRAVEKILIANRIIEEPDKEAELTYTSFRDNLSFENEADNVGNSVTEGGEIARARVARDFKENPNSGVYNAKTEELSEEQRREFEEKYARRDLSTRSDIDIDR